MVILSRIYTRTGDDGTTGLVGAVRTAKSSALIEAIGDVDEANASIGLAMAQGTLDQQLAELLGVVQNELFDLGADLATPVTEDEGESDHPPLRILPASVRRLEDWCDTYAADLPALRSFLLPTGTPTGAQLHVGRTVVRRAERSVWRAVDAGDESGRHSAQRPDPHSLNPLTATYLNRLSDLLFILVRVVNGPTRETLWVPGKDRSAPTPSDRRDDETAAPDSSDDQTAAGRESSI